MIFNYSSVQHHLSMVSIQILQISVHFSKIVCWFKFINSEQLKSNISKCATNDVIWISSINLAQNFSNRIISNNWNHLTEHTTITTDLFIGWTARLVDIDIKYLVNREIAKCHDVGWSPQLSERLHTNNRSF